MRKKNWEGRLVSRTYSAIRLRRWDESLLTSLLDHLAADALAAELGMGGEVEHLDLVAVQLVDHESDDPLAELGDHADAVPLPEHAEELLLAPGELETRMLDGQNLGHVAPDHPANVHAGLGR